MELPYGLTLDEVKEIVDQYDNLYNDVEQGREPKPEYDGDGCPNYDEWCECARYIDRYIQIGDAEYCITTDKSSDETWLSETVTVSTDRDPEKWFISELYELVGR